MIELWYAPKGYKIAEHSHPNEDIELYFLYGDALFVRNGVDKFHAVSPKHSFKHFSIRAGDNHYFEVSNKPLIFLNIEHWKGTTKPSSASKDFKLKET